MVAVCACVCVMLHFKIVKLSVCVCNHFFIPSTKKKIAALAIELEMVEDAEKLYMEAGRWDLLVNLLQSFCFFFLHKKICYSWSPSPSSSPKKKKSFKKKQTKKKRLWSLERSASDMCETRQNPS